MKKTNSQENINHSLLNIITPMGGLEFERHKIVLGENIAKIYAVIKYPPAIELGWAAKISNIPRAITCQIFEPCDNGDLIEYLSRSVTQNRSIAESTRDALKRQRAEKAATDADKLITQIDQLGETIGYMTNLIMPIAQDEAHLDRICRSVESIMAAMKCKTRVLGNLQKEALQAVSPYHTTIEQITNIAKRNVPLSTFAGGFPFASSGYTDRQGYYFAKDAGGGLIILDPWKRGGDRTNSNFTIMGVPGVGKSTVAKHIIMSEYMMGTKVIIVDVDREYKELCLNLGGAYIDCAGGSEGRINPLQIRPVPKDHDDEETEAESERLYSEKDEGMGAMALHFKTLEIFFRLYMPDISEFQMAMLKRLLEEMFAAFKITWNTDITDFGNEDFPSFHDLYAVVRKKQEEDKSEDLKYLSALIRELAEGADRFLFNDHTAISPQTRCICLDTFNLQNASDNLKKTQYFNLLTWAWEIMSRNRSEKVLLVCDEAYLLIDPHVPQSLIFLRNVAKRARKYEAALMIISHSVADFLDPSIKQYGQALLDIPAYKILMGTDGVNLRETAELYSLTEIEQDHLFNKRRGTAIFMTGSKRLFVKFEIPAYKFKYMGKKGGR